MSPKAHVIAALQSFGPCPAAEIDMDLFSRRKLGIIDLHEWPRSARALDFLEQLEREGKARQVGKLWEWIRDDVPAAVEPVQKTLF